jgi:hypothetical protein
MRDFHYYNNNPWNRNPLVNIHSSLEEQRLQGLTGNSSTAHDEPVVDNASAAADGGNCPRYVRWDDGGEDRVETDVRDRLSTDDEKMRRCKNI